MAEPTVSVLIATFNRSRLLRRAIDSVLKQDYKDFEIVVVDDCSPDDTSQVMSTIDDPRIRYLRNKTNVGRLHGDREIFRRFVYEYSNSEFFVYLCDDDFWIPSDLLSRQVALMRAHPSLAMIAGGQVQIYPNPIDKVPAIGSYWHYEPTPEIAGGMAMRSVYPAGFHTSEGFLRLFAVDPVVRNLLTGATLFRRSSFGKARVLGSSRGSRWQAGYELTAGTATAGDAWYLDEPCIASAVDIGSASFRGTQLDHMKDCLKSIGIAFRACRDFLDPAAARRYMDIERQMKHAIVFNYVLNRIGFRLGWFGDGPLAGIERIFHSQIGIPTFLWYIYGNGLPMSEDNKRLLRMAAMPMPLLRRIEAEEFGRHGPAWPQVLRRYPSAGMTQNVTESKAG